MTIQEVLPSFTPLDAIAVAVFLLSWLGISMMIENQKAKRPSVSVLMMAYRREWMHHSITRDPRVFDAIILTSLRDGTAFFASASLIALGGGLALIGNVEQVAGLASDLSLDQRPEVIWEVKLLLVVLFVTNAFLKFVWANRLFGYCSVLMGAVPNHDETPLTIHRSEQAAELNITAARAFNRGLRSVYFALCALAWLPGAVPLLVATGLTLLLLWRREYASHSRAVLEKNVPRRR